MIKLFWFLPVLGSRGTGSLFPRCLSSALSYLENRNHYNCCALLLGGRSADWGVHTPALGVVIKPNPRSAAGHRTGRARPEPWPGFAASAEAAGSAERRRRARDRKDCPGWILLISLWLICARNSFFCRVCSNSAW